MQASAVRDKSGGPHRTRIVACQGAVQLASAIAAMRTMSDQADANCAADNHLVIHDLSAPDGQIDEFAKCIRQLADKVERWSSIRFLNPSDVASLQSRLREKNTGPTSLLQETLRIEGCDELFVGQNNKFVPTWLRQASVNARQVCFGDGLALNFTNSYFRPNKQALGESSCSLSVRWKQRIKHGLRQFRKSQSISPASESNYHSHCLLLKNLFDQRLENVNLIEPSLFLELFECFAEDFVDKAPAAHLALTKLSRNPGINVVLLTSNFSETGRMSLEGELLGYSRLLEKLPQGGGVTLIVKPHPRDSYEKIMRLQRITAEFYSHTIALDDPWTFYLPFESLYAKYLSPSVNHIRQTHVATVSSACIALEYLYNQACTLGFGRELVDQEFVPLWRSLRQVHETDLQRIVCDLRKKSPRAWYGRKISA